MKKTRIKYAALNAPIHLCSAAYIQEVNLLFYYNKLVYVLL